MSYTAHVLLGWTVHVPEREVQEDGVALGDRL